MGQYDSGPRKLSWDLSFTLVANRTTENDGEDCEPVVFNWPEDSDERVLVPFHLSLNEYNVLASAIDVGSDIAFGEDAIRVTWLWLRNMRCKVDLCAMIADCIATSPGAQEALRDFITGDQVINNHFTEITQSLTTEQITGTIMPNDCANANVAGRVVALVERFNIIIEDAFDIIEVGTNDEEKIAAIIEGIPGLGIAPIDDILDFMQDLLEDFSENYSAAVTEEWKDDVEEDLYCLALGKPDCALTYQDLFEYFQARAGSGLNILSTIFDVIDFVRDGDFNTDDLVASGMYAILLGFLLTGQEFFGMNLPRIGAITRDALPSSKWVDWDDCTPDPVQNINLVNSAPSVYPSSLTWIGNPPGQPDQDIWEVTSVEAIGNAAYVGYAVKDNANRCLRLVAYTAPPSECFAADINCAGGYVDQGTSHPIPDEAREITGNTRIPTVPNVGTIGSVFTFTLELV